MSDFMKQIEEASAKIQQLQRECEDHERTAQSHESAAREERRARTVKKNELAGLTVVLASMRVQAKIQSEEELAAKARQEAEALAAQNVVKQKELDELLAKAKANVQ
jgi:hypothetical protein